MKTKIYVIIATILVALIVGISLLTFRLNNVIRDRNVYKSNNDVLMTDIKKYQTKDSLNAASVGELQYKLSEYAKYRSNDLAIIKTLQVKNRDLQAITTTQSQTILNIQGSVKDSIIYRDNIIIDTLKCFDINDKWFDLKGCIDRNKKFIGTFVGRDSLIVAETVKYKRFLGFMWKTSKIKDRKIDIVSKNPNTVILGVEYITIRE